MHPSYCMLPNTLWNTLLIGQDCTLPVCSTALQSNPSGHSQLFSLYVLKFTPIWTPLHTASVLNRILQFLPLSMFSSILLNILSRILSIPLNGTLPAWLNVGFHVCSQDARKPTLEHALKDTQVCTRLCTPSLHGLYSHVSPQNAPKYTCRHVHKYTPEYAVKIRPNGTRWNTSSLLDCMLGRMLLSMLWSTVLSMLSSELPIALDDTLPAHLALHSQVHSEDAKHSQTNRTIWSYECICLLVPETCCIGKCKLVWKLHDPIPYTLVVLTSNPNVLQMLPVTPDARQTLSDVASISSGVSESTCSHRQEFKMLQDKTYRISKFRSSWDLWAELRQTSGAAWDHLPSSAGDFNSTWWDFYAAVPETLNLVRYPQSSGSYGLTVTSHFVNHIHLCYHPKMISDLSRGHVLLISVYL